MPSKLHRNLFALRGRASAYGAMGRRIDPSWWTTELFLVAASAK